MVTVVLLDTGEELDVIKSSIRYVKQVSDIGDVTKVNTSYSWGMEFPFTPRNVSTFKSLGVVGDTSDAPYKKIRVNILDNGLSIVQNGLLQIKYTDGRYKAYIQDGIVDFFKDVATDKISEVIDLDDLTHQNTVQNIINSFTSNTYRYIIANYNGKPRANINGVTDLDPFALIPSIGIGYLFDRIMAHYGWTYSGDINLDNLWMTYPNATGFTTDDNLAPILETTLIDKEYIGPNQGPGSNRLKLEHTVTTIDTDFIQVLQTINGNPAAFYFQQPGNYKITFSVQGYSSHVIGFLVDFSLFLTVNGIPVTSPLPVFLDLNEDDVATIEYNIIAQENHIISLTGRMDLGVSQRVSIEEGSMKIEQLGVQNIDFSEALISVKVNDFFKEILTRQALTPFADIDHKNLHFIDVENRLNADIIDWSSRYVTRKKEAYVYDSYAKVNTLTHKYDNQDEDFNDGILEVRNENLAEDKNLYKSFTHSPLEDFVTYQGQSFPTFEVNNFKMFEVEITEDPDTGDLIAEYKPIKNRFYIFESETRTDIIYILGSPVFEFPLAVLGGNTFKDIVAAKYQELNRILDDTRIHDIELALSKWDVATLDQSKRYYFAQEAAIYLFNKLTWETEDTCVGQFVRLTEIQNNVLTSRTEITR